VYTDALPKVTIDLARVRRNIQDIRASTGVDVIAVVKADGYGHGLIEVARAVADLVAAFYVFRPSEAIETHLHRETGKPVLAAMTDGESAENLIAHDIHAAVWDTETARRYGATRPIIAIDTGQQRFACPPERIDEVIQAGAIEEGFTHASTAAQAAQFAELTAGRLRRRHAAGTSLLDQPVARFDAVRPGLAMYRGAMRVSARLLEARDTRGPAGYTGFQVPRHGVIIGGYSNGITAGPCIVNGVKRRLLEVGMQSAFVELGPADKPGDEVILLGDGLTEKDLADAWRTSPQEVMVRLGRCGRRAYSSP